jgi:ATP-dependent RNA helicase DDX35
MFPVEVCYLKEPVMDYCEAAVETVFNIHMKVSARIPSRLTLTASPV